MRCANRATDGEAGLRAVTGSPPLLLQMTGKADWQVDREAYWESYPRDGWESHRTGGHCVASVVRSPSRGAAAAALQLDESAGCTLGRLRPPSSEGLPRLQAEELPC